MLRRETARQSCIDYVTRMNYHRCFMVNSDVALPLYGLDVRKSVNILDLHTVLNVPFFVEVDGKIVGQGFEDLLLALNKARESEASALGRNVRPVEKPSCTMRHAIGYVHCSHVEHLQDLSSHSLCSCAARSTSLALTAQTATLCDLVRPGTLRYLSFFIVTFKLHVNKHHFNQSITLCLSCDIPAYYVYCI